jgi:hypothetical protein
MRLRAGTADAEAMSATTLTPAPPEVSPALEAWQREVEWVLSHLDDVTDGGRDMMRTVLNTLAQDPDSDALVRRDIIRLLAAIERPRTVDVVAADPRD